MAQPIKVHRHIKISATVDTELLQAMEAQFLAPQSQQEQEEHAAWHHIQTAATQALYRSWDANDLRR